MVEPYRHTPLRDDRSIRVLHLLPSRDLSTTLHCKMKVVPLDNAPKYEALSYAWDSETPDRDIVCGNKPIRITANCAAALRRLRRCSKARVLWIDAVCISQGDERELNQQVRMMGDIYKNAHQVVVWLGEGDSDSDLAFKYFNKISRHFTRRFIPLFVAERLSERALRQAKSIAEGEQSVLYGFC